MAGTLADHLAAMPLVAILRGLAPEDAAAAGEALVEAGFGIIEVPLNSPRPFESISVLADRYGGQALVGAGTVRSVEDAGRVADAGGRLIVMPHAEEAVVRAAVRLTLWCIPGVATPTEGFAALDAGADALKLFPAEALPPPVVKAWRAVFPPETALLPVGGITPDRMGPYLAAGATGFGLGSALWRPGTDVAELGRRARAFVAAFREQASRVAG
jgi:2-dehydro-3-deoxyphosphogalactonate aldolase